MSDEIKDEQEMKMEPSSPSERDRSVHSRCSSVGSALSPSSSGHNTEGTDDSGDNSKDSTMDFKASKEFQRRAHRMAENKRRQGINEGYASLYNLLPTEDPTAGYKLSKATILWKSIDYIGSLQAQQQQHDEECELLEREVKSLKLIEQVYKTMSEQQQESPELAEARLTDDVQFQVFQSMMDEMFVSFGQLKMDSVSELRTDVFPWLEENCKPQQLKDMVNRGLAKVTAQLTEGPSTSNSDHEQDNKQD